MRPSPRCRSRTAVESPGDGCTGQDSSARPGRRCSRMTVSCGGEEPGGRGRIAGRRSGIDAPRRSLVVEAWGSAHARRPLEPFSADAGLSVTQCAPLGSTEREQPVVVERYGGLAIRGAEAEPRVVRGGTRLLVGVVIDRRDGSTLVCRHSCPVRRTGGQAVPLLRCRSISSLDDGPHADLDGASDLELLRRRHAAGRFGTLAVECPMLVERGQATRDSSARTGPRSPVRRSHGPQGHERTVESGPLPRRLVRPLGRGFIANRFRIDATGGQIPGHSA